MLSRELNRPPRIALITDTAWKSGCEPAQAGVADADLGLDGAGAVDHADEPLRRRRRCRRSAAVAPAPEAGQSPNSASATREDDVGIDVTGDHQRRSFRDVGGRVDATQVRRGQAGDGLRRAARRSVVWAGRCVDGRDVRLVGATARVRLRLEQVREALVAQALHLGDRERRPAHDLGQQLHGGLEAGGRDVEPGGGRVPARLGVERRAETLGRLGQGDGVAELRALGQGAGGEDRRPADRGGLVHGAGAQGEGRRHQGAPGHGRDHHAEAVGERRPDGVREVVRAGAGPAPGAR